jgi:hypothetical protein
MGSHQRIDAPASAYVDQLFIALMSTLRSYQNRHGKSNRTDQEMITALAMVIGPLAKKTKTHELFVDAYQRALTD